MKINRNSKITRLACIAFIALAAATTSRANVLTNPGFETDAVLNAGPVPGATGWTISGNANTASANGNPVRTGIGSLQLAGFGGFGVPLAYQTFAATPGDTWNFQGYMLTPSALPASATFGLLKIVWLNSGGGEIQPGSALIGTANNGANPGIESTPFLNNASTANTWIFTRAQGTAPAGTTQVRLFALFVDQNAGTGYFDDLDSTNAPGVPPPVVINYPTNNAPTPPARAPSVVKSMYNSSGTYTDVPIDNWYAGWSGNPGGNSDFGITNPPSPTVTSTVKKYLGLNYAGVEFYGGNHVDATGLNTLHVDLWTPNANQFGIQLVSLVTGTQAGQVNFTPASGTITTNGWVSLNIPLTQFTAANPNLILTNLEQLLWIDNQAGGYVNGNFYIDNVYFYATATPPTIVAPAVGGGNFTAQSASQLGFNYVLQGTTSLSPVSWTNIQTNAGTGGTLSFTVPVAGNPQRFFRIKVQ
ncbi:MAG: hypothetical protein EXS35_11955 [Pedosphaera sp.]|nr:hypothetical protein [Pedosphaera sp.]